jgi:hypothetical protein
LLSSSPTCVLYENILTFASWQPLYFRDIAGTTPSNYFEENVRNGEGRLDSDSQLYRHENPDYPSDGK